MVYPLVLSVDWSVRTAGGSSSCLNREKDAKICGASAQSTSRGLHRGMAEQGKQRGLTAGVGPLPESHA